MPDTDSTTASRSFLERQRDAALEQLREQQAEFNRVAEIVLPQRPGAIPSTRQRVTDVIKLGDDYLVEVTDRDAVTWTFVVGGERTSWRHKRQEDAILHLIATRYDSNPNSNHAAAFYAGRVLGIADTNES